MIRTLFSLLVMLAAALAGVLWLARDLEPGAIPAALPRLHTVDLNDLVDSALEAARQRGAPRSAPEAAPSREERVSAPTPFDEAPLPEGVDPAGAQPAPRPEPGSLVVAARDQDAWAALIRRMLDLQRRAGPR